MKICSQFLIKSTLRFPLLIRMNFTALFYHNVLTLLENQLQIIVRSQFILIFRISTRYSSLLLLIVKTRILKRSFRYIREFKRFQPPSIVRTRTRTFVQVDRRLYSTIVNLNEIQALLYKVLIYRAIKSNIIK